MTDLAIRPTPQIEHRPVWEPDHELTFEEYLDAGHQLFQLNRVSQWWIGDWCNYGEARYGQKYEQAARETGYDRGTLKNIASVAGRIEASRRRDDLSFTHHVEVVDLPEEERYALLDRAAREGLSTGALRHEAKALKPPPAPAPPEPDPEHIYLATITFTVGADDVEEANAKVKALADRIASAGATIKHKEAREIA